METVISAPANKRLWTPSVVFWLTLLLNMPGGIVLAALNWFKLGLKHKAAWHLGLGLVLSFTYKYFLYRDLDTQPAARLLIDLCLSLVVAIYLDKQLEADYQRYQQQGEGIERANWLVAVGVAIVAGAAVTITSGFLAYRSITAHWASLHNHVYCELLTLGMTTAEANAALSTLGTAGQMDWYKIPETASSQVKHFRTVVWDDFDLEWNNRLHVGLGYDTGDRLVWKAIRVGVTSFVTVDCPVTLDNIAYRR